jgi:hypothetical protein
MTAATLTIFGPKGKKRIALQPKGVVLAGQLLDNAKASRDGTGEKTEVSGEVHRRPLARALLQPVWQERCNRQQACPTVRDR